MSNFVPISEAIKHQLLTQLYEQFDDIIFLLDEDLRYLSVNKAYEEKIGYEEKLLIGKPLGIHATELLSEDERVLLKDIKTSLNNTGFYQRELSLTLNNGQTLDCHMTYQKTYMNGIVYYIGMLRDISAVVKNKKRILRVLNFNHLTGLSNGKVLLSQTGKLLKENHQQIVMVRLNIDRYRILANALGTDGVNTLIRHFVTRINELNLDNLINFSHFGGDDFALVFELSDAKMVNQQLDQLMQICNSPFSIDNDLIYLHLSVGISYFPEHGNQMATLLTKAEKALHHMKQQGGSDICWYSNELSNIEPANSLQLEAELREAINKCQFIPHYQPKVVLATGEINGFEALVRWQHPSRGLLQPADFIEAIVKHKLSFKLFCQMAKQVAEQLSHWQSLGFTPKICINADAAEFSYSDFLGFISELFIQYEINPHQFHIEVTESSLMVRDACVREKLAALKKLGVYLSLDDFGTGYASLSYLKEYPFDFIKIDRTFISEIAKSPTQHAIVKAIFDLGIALNMGVIAEGIETKKQRDLLVKMGCIYGQGYWFGRPAPADIATKMLIERFIIK